MGEGRQRSAYHHTLALRRDYRLNYLSKGILGLTDLDWALSVRGVWLVLRWEDSCTLIFVFFVIVSFSDQIKESAC